MRYFGRTALHSIPTRTTKLGVILNLVLKFFIQPTRSLQIHLRPHKIFYDRIKVIKIEKERIKIRAYLCGRRTIHKELCNIFFKYGFPNLRPLSAPMRIKMKKKVFLEAWKNLELYWNSERNSFIVLETNNFNFISFCRIQLGIILVSWIATIDFSSVLSLRVASHKFFKKLYEMTLKYVFSKIKNVKR